MCCVLNALGAEANISADRAAEQKWILQDDAEAAAQVGEIHFFHIDAVDADRAFLHIVETQQQRDERGLAGAGVADDGYGFSGLDGEGYVAEDPVGSWIAGSRIARGQRRASRALLGWTAEGGRPHMVLPFSAVLAVAPARRDRRTRRDRTRCGRGLRGFFVTAGETMSTGVSSSLKMRSLAAMADCRMLYFSLKSMMGRKKRSAYCDERDQHAERSRGRDQVERDQRLPIELDGNAGGDDAAHHVAAAEPDHAGNRDRGEEYRPPGSRPSRP